MDIFLGGGDLKGKYGVWPRGCRIFGLKIGQHIEHDAGLIYVSEPLGCSDFEIKDERDQCIYIYYTHR